LKKFGILALFAIGMTAASCAHTARSARTDEAFALLRAGGNLIVMRHATSPAGQTAPVGMTEGCILAPGRGLSAQGFFEARFIGALLAENGVTIDKTYTSDLCRSYDTARLVAAAGSGPVLPAVELKSDDPALADAFKAALDAELAATPSANILLVTHSNVTPLYWSGPLDGEEETPSGRVHVIRKLTGADGEAAWVVIRIDVKPEISAPEIAGVRAAVGAGANLN
jgi:phosphohistidine phosphatase SixA